tara:strand:- start:23 stop:892 length:870 start_codon:yes stop_codon:yes gene_type:complete
MEQATKTTTKTQNISQTIEDIEIKLLLYAIYQRYGYDFQDYSYSSQQRRLKDILKKYNLNFFSELQNMILRDENFFSQVLCDMTITVSEFFRDPEIYKALREHITDELKTYPHIKIWHAGCATGEEVYSMAILLKEEKLYDKAQIYATDINTRALNKAKKGINSSNSFTKASEQYFMAGGKESLSNYYSADDKSVLIAPSLHKNIVFSDHNLVSDSKFGEMNLILCRNVLIYFNKDLQNRALKLMADSLVPGGFLVLGTKESITFTDIAKDFEKFCDKEKIYRKRWKSS